MRVLDLVGREVHSAIRSDAPEGDGSQIHSHRICRESQSPPHDGKHFRAKSSNRTEPSAALTRLKSLSASSANLVRMTRALATVGPFTRIKTFRAENGWATRPAPRRVLVASPVSQQDGVIDALLAEAVAP